MDEKVWRVVSSYLEMEDNSGKIENMVSLPGAIPAARSKHFNSVEHKSLNAELKYLYTAVTRAKCNLWIYDSNLKARLPMLDYWHKRNAVKIVTAFSDMDQNYNLVFASNSTSDQWKAQGDNFRKKHFWEQAVLCYTRAGSDFIHLVKEAQAFNFIQAARQQKAGLFQDAALKFLESDESKHSVQCISAAALCFKNSKPPKYIQAAKLFERLGDLVKAAQSYLKTKEYDNFARVMERRGQYDSVIRVLLGKPIMRKRDALAKADEYEKKGILLDPKYTTSELSFWCAKFYSERKDKQTLLEVLKFMPEQEKKLKFMKEAELYEEAYEESVANQQFSGAYRIALAHGWSSKAIGLASQEGDHLNWAVFTLLEAKSNYIRLQDIPEKDAAATLNLIKEDLSQAATFKDDPVRAEAHLLLGMVQKAQGLCVQAKREFYNMKHKAGILEAFQQEHTIGETSIPDILDCCHIAKRASNTLRSSADMNIDVQKAVKFYGLVLVGKTYLTSRFYHVWINFEILQKFKCKDAEYDIDHMIRLKHEVREMIAERYDSFKGAWLGAIESKKLRTKWKSFKLCAELWNHRSLSRQYSLEEVSSTAMTEYIHNCVYMLQLRLLRNESGDAMLLHFEILFSPEVSSCLPCLNSQHVNIIRRSKHASNCFKKKIENDLKMCSECSDRLSIDLWLRTWRLSVIYTPCMKLLLTKLDALEEDINSQDKECTPLGFIFWKSEKCYRHIFRFWLNSCREIRENSKVLWASKLAINHFLGNIVEDKRISISIINVVNVLTIHCMSLFAMMTHSNFIQNYSPKFIVPRAYEHVVQLFNHMNCTSATSHASLFSACVKEVSSHWNAQKLFTECKILLNRAMSYLVGSYKRAQKYPFLKFGLQRFTGSSSTLHCLVLTLTLIGNLSMIQDVRKYEVKIFNMFKVLADKNEAVPNYVIKVLTFYQMHPPGLGYRRTHGFFELVKILLTIAEKDTTMSMIMFTQKDSKQGHIKLMTMTKDGGFVNKPVLSSRLNLNPPAGVCAPLPPVEAILQPLTQHVDQTMSETDNPSSLIPSNAPGFPHSVNTKQPYSALHSSASFSSCVDHMPPVKSYSLSASAEPFIPEEYPTNISSPLQVPSSAHMLQSSLNSGASPGTGLSSSTDFSEQFHHIDDQYSLENEAGADEDSTIEDDLEDGYLLTQPQTRSVGIDPSLVTEDIIDSENNFCNACGVNYQPEDEGDMAEILGKPILESFCSHVTSNAHSERSQTFCLFLKAVDNNELLNLAEEMFKQCLDIKEAIGTDLLDRAIDNLKEEINKYNINISEVNDDRNWKIGIKNISESNKTFEFLLKKVNDQLQNSNFAQLKENLEMKEGMMELEEDQDEIEKLSESYVNNVDHLPIDTHKKGQARTEKEKVMSRAKKRDKKRKRKV